MLKTYLSKIKIKMLTNSTNPISSHLPQYFFKDLFNLYFHNKYSFDDFIKININDSVEKIKFRDKTIFKLSKESPLKEFHKFIHLFILNNLKTHKVCFSYTKNLNIKDCLEPHKNSKYFISTDIHDFFNNITKNDILNILNKNLEFINISDISKYLEFIASIVVVNDRLPVGFSTSGVISNSVLFDFDTLIEKYCKQNNIIYTRYSDDLIFSGNNKSTKNVLNEVDNILLKLFNTRLLRNKRKTIFYSHKSRVEILGLVITPNGNITINKELKSKIENLMYFYINDKGKFKNILNNEFKNDIKNIFALIAYINSVDNFFMQKLKKKYGNFVIDSFLRKSANV
jgi:RNA-directed DNA polymerase